MQRNGFPVTNYQVILATFAVYELVAGDCIKRFLSVSFYSELKTISTPGNRFL
ncbi:MAG: hypothetical protein ACO1G9_01650 [Bacteroidota bacterium]